ncbi:MAG: hypothetical protein H0V89_04660, partial [Deltaproteobacteria bacterium]|nr:hypothetical protein [Deltaproteobacteria bacterium]
MSTAFNMALGTGVILGFGSLSLDLGYANFARTQVHAAADAAAIAGAISVLNDQPNAAVIASASSWGEANDVGSVEVVVDNADIRRGTWDGTTFVESNAGRDVWVRAHTEGTSAFLSRIWGQENLDTQAVSIARAEPPTVCTVIGVDTAEVGGNGNVFGYDSSVSLDPALSEDPSAGICSNNVTIDIFGNA